MAIILEQQKKPIQAASIIVMIVVLLVLSGVAYLLFYAKGKETTSIPQGDVTGGVSKINIQKFNDVTSGKVFTGLQEYPPLSLEIVKSHLGKVNPFQKY